MFVAKIQRISHLAWLALCRLYRYAHGTCGIDRAELKEYQDLERTPYPPPREDDIRKTFVTKLAAGIDLVKHEDSLNWSKFYNMAYVNMGLLGAFGYISAQPAPNRVLLMRVIAVVGTAAAVGFTLTLWSGLCCLDGHKKIIRNLDRHMAGVESLFSGRPRPEPEEIPSEYLCEAGLCNAKPGSIFLGKKGPSRSLLRGAPVGALLLWVFLFITCALDPGAVKPSGTQAGGSSADAVQPVDDDAPANSQAKEDED